MKRNSLTTAVVAGIAGVAGFAGLANAVDLNPDGLGQVLIYPYYTVNKGQDTMLSVVNTTDVGKAVKVRFLEAYNSREVLDFNLFLSAHDVWTAVITQPDHADTGGAVVKTADKSCTYPPFPASGQVAFRKNAYAGGAPAPFNAPDDGPQNIERTREGYFEIISMGDIRPGSATEGRITHDQESPYEPNAGTPPGCGQITNGNVSGDLDAPTSGLFGSAAVINGQEGTFFGYNADAIDGFTAIPIYSGSSALEPSLQQANSDEATGGVARAYLFISGQLLIADYAKGEDAVSAVYMSDALYNEYLVGGGIGASSDWVVTFPTKRYYVDGAIYAGVPFPPFESAFTGTSNIRVGINLYDQEEGFTTQPDDFSPPVVDAPSSLRYEVNIISFINDATTGEVSGVFGSVLNSNIPPIASAGWLKLDLTGGTHYLDTGISPTQGAVTLYGLPATGFYGYNVINANPENNPDRLANYGGLFRHRASRSCSAATAGGACS